MGRRRRCGSAHGDPGGCGGIYRDNKYTDIHVCTVGTDGTVGSDNVDVEDLRAEHFDEHLCAEHLDVEDIDILDVDEDGEHQQQHFYADDPCARRIGGGVRPQARHDSGDQPHEGICGS